MKTLLLPAAADRNMQRAAEILRHGGLVVFPTDTVYGLGALAFHSAAVESIFRAKRRPRDKSIPILLSSADEMSLVAANIGETAWRLAQEFWPGPLTLVIPKNDRVPQAVAGATIGVRVPDHAIARALLRLTGPLAVTSANLSGSESPVTAAEAMRQLDGRVNLILDGGRTPGGMPSTVVDCSGEELAILRAGPIELHDLQAALASFGSGNALGPENED